MKDKHILKYTKKEKHNKMKQLKCSFEDVQIIGINCSVFLNLKKKTSSSPYE